MVDRRPLCTVIGGSNGSGKSSIYEALRPRGAFINADAVARVIAPEQPETASFAAGRQVLQRLATVIEAREDFAYEMTLSGNQPLDVLRRAQGAGYETGLVFVLLASVDLNVDRVAQRVAQGGHGIPEAIIRRRYDKSLNRLGAAIRLCDETIVLDNTALVPFELIRLRTGAIVESHLDPALPMHERLLQAVPSATGANGSSLEQS